jgi:hypothetical protein
MLGNDVDRLISREQGAEALGVGDWNENYKKWEEEKKILPKEEIITENNVNNKNNSKKPKLGSVPKK